MSNLNELLKKRAELSQKMNDLADAAEKRETKEFTEEEKAQLASLRGELNIVRAKIEAHNSTPVPSERENFQTILQDMRKNPGKEYVISKRAISHILTSDVTPIAPLTINDIVEPLEKGLILDKVGIPLSMGLSGQYQWPVLSIVEASVANEAVDLADANIPMTSLTPTPQRLGITIPVSNQAINKSADAALNIITQQIPLALQRTLNRIMFCTEKVSTRLFGPLYGASTQGSFAGAVPTFAELLALKGAVLNTGVVADETMCFVMSEAMKATLEATPIDAGSGRMIVENGRIAGYPIFCTNYINLKADGTATAKENIAFGIWSYEPLGQFGDLRLTYDPYSGAPADIVRFTLNSDWAMTCLRPEAFAWKAVQ